MKNLYLSIQRFINDEEGVTAIEYALIAAGIAIAIVATVYLVGGAVNEKFQCILDCLGGGGGGS